MPDRLPNCRTAEIACTVSEMHALSPKLAGKRCMIREEYGQIAYQTLPNILLSNASLVTKSCIDLSMTTHLTRAR